MGNVRPRGSGRSKGDTVPDTITITDDRTGKKVTVPIDNGTFPSSALRELDPDLRVYDPAFLSTAACASAITYLDGDAGILRYRGYPIEQLAEQSTLPRGGLPPAQRRAAQRRAARAMESTTSPTTRSSTRTCASGSWRASTTTPTPWACSSQRLAALSTFYPDAKDIFDADSRDKQILRLIAKMPTLAAYCHRFSVGMPFVYPDNELSYPGNFLTMMWKVGDVRDRPRPRARARRAVHPPRRPRAELRHHGDAGGRLLPRRPVQRRPRPLPPPCTARSTAAPTRPSCACSPRSGRWTTCRRSSTT